MTGARERSVSLKVVHLTAIAPHYRTKFCELARDNLRECGIEYNVVYGQPNKKDEKKNDVVDMPWATSIRNIYSDSEGRAIWQPALSLILKADLAIIGQENRLLINYPLQSFHNQIRPRIALWGHGKNFQSGQPSSVKERWKRYWSTRCDWWFAYTDESKRLVSSYGFPEDRITVLNNSIDTDAVKESAENSNSDRIAAIKERYEINSPNVGIFIGGLHAHKQLRFLISACDLVRNQIPDFQLVIVGAGAEGDAVADLISGREWAKATGALFGNEKTDLMLLSKLYLMPGLIGLGILDAACVGLPVVTTNYPFHSPEFSYLENGVNSVITQWGNKEAYASAIVALMSNESVRSRLSAGARSLSERYSISNMALAFSDGVSSSLVRAKRRF